MNYGELIYKIEKAKMDYYQTGRSELSDAEYDSLVEQADEFMNLPENDTPIKGLNFVITGSLNHFSNRDELKNKIESLGGKVVGSVSKNTNYLINNDTASTSSKNEKAKKLGIPIISEEEFIGIIK